MKPPKSCIEQGCGHLALPSGSRCSAHAKLHKESKWAAGKTGQRGSRPGWSKLVKRVKERDRDRCRLCGSFLMVEVHHVNMVATDDRMSNLLTVCHDHHKFLHREKAPMPEVPKQLTIEECIAIAEEEDLHRLAKYPKTTIKDVVRERLNREANIGQEGE